MLKQFLKWVINPFGSKPQNLPKYKPVENLPIEQVKHKPKVHILAFRKEQLIGKAFIYRTYMIRLMKSLGITGNKFKYEVTYKKLI